MLRVGLTGGLGSGKSTVAAMLAQHGAYVLEADAIGRDMMRPGERVYAAIVERFGPGVVKAGGELDRAELARLAFGEGRVEELNAIVHPAVIARQAELAEEIFAKDPGGIVVVESALIFETRYGETSVQRTSGGRVECGMKEHGSGWRARFDRLVLVAASRESKIARYVERQGGRRERDAAARVALEREAEGRLERQMPDEQKAKECDYVIDNVGTPGELKVKVDTLWERLRRDANSVRTR